MEYENIKRLMEDMSKSTLTSIDIDFPDGTKISMKKENTKVLNVNEINCENTKIAETKQATSVEENSSTNEQSKIIKSPMVGTFYLKPSPTSTPFVEVGKEIKKGDTVCIIEAMKLMNEIESEYDGKITEILIKDGEPVEYGTPLFKVN